MYGHMSSDKINKISLSRQWWNN